MAGSETIGSSKLIVAGECVIVFTSGALIAKGRFGEDYRQLRAIGICNPDCDSDWLNTRFYRGEYRFMYNHLPFSGYNDPRLTNDNGGLCTPGCVLANDRWTPVGCREMNTMAANGNGHAGRLSCGYCQYQA